MIALLGGRWLLHKDGRLVACPASMTPIFREPRRFGLSARAVARREDESQEVHARRALEMALHKGWIRVRRDHDTVMFAYWQLTRATAAAIVRFVETLHRIGKVEWVACVEQSSGRSLSTSVSTFLDPGRRASGEGRPGAAGATHLWLMGRATGQGRRGGRPGGVARTADGRRARLLRLLPRLE